MIEVVFAILMIQNGKVIEYVPTSGMADCLEQKRIVTRQIGEDQAGTVSYTHLTLPTKRIV